MGKAMKDMTPEERQAAHREAEKGVRTFRFERPPASSRPKQVVRMLSTDQLQIAMQVVKAGGENNLHYHTSVAEGWMVIKGRAKFYGPGDALLADLGPMEGIHIPANARYWFEQAGSEELELLQIMAYDESATEKSERYNAEPTKDWMVEDIFKRNDPSMKG